LVHTTCISVSSSCVCVCVYMCMYVCMYGCQREWCLLDVYWLASIVSMFELPEITSYIADEFKDIGRFGRIELTMSPRHTLFWLPIVMSVENLVFFHMKTKLDSEPEVTFGKFNGH